MIEWRLAMADAENAKTGDDDLSLLAAEASDPVVLQEPDRAATPVDEPTIASPIAPRRSRRSRG